MPTGVAPPARPLTFLRDMVPNHVASVRSPIASTSWTRMPQQHELNLMILFACRRRMVSSDDRLVRQPG